MDKIKRYFGFGPDLYEAEGWFSLEHLLFVTIAIILTALIAILLSKKYKKKDEKEKLKPLKVASIIMVSCELLKIVLDCMRHHDFWAFRSVLPLYLCSILLFSLPIAAFAKGKIQEAALDFSQIFGYIACIAGTYLAGNIFESPILSFHVNVSVFTHCISGFAALYITLSGLSRMNKKNIWMTSLILLVFEIMALVVDIIQLNSNYQHNFMFFMSPDGTPFSILMTLAGNIQVLYTIFVMLIYFVYMFLFILGYNLIIKIRRKNK